MRASGAAGRADLAEGLSDAHRLSHFHVDLGHVAVARGKSVVVVDLDHIAIAALPAGDADRAVGGDAHRIALVAAQVDAGMNRRPLHEWIHAHAERRTHIHFADHRFAYRNGNQRVAVTVDLRARVIDAIELALERAGARMRRFDRHERTADRGVLWRLADIDTQVSEHAKHAARLAVDLLFQIGQRGGLPALDFVERKRDAR